MTVLICKTCPRYVQGVNGEFGRALTEALRDAGATTQHVLATRNVLCLGGCPNNGVAALDDPGKARVRFTGLASEHARPLLAAAAAYDTSGTGHPDDWPVPEPLRPHLSSITVKRLPVPLKCRQT